MYVMCVVQWYATCRWRVFLRIRWGQSQVLYAATPGKPGNSIFGVQNTFLDPRLGIHLNGLFGVFNSLPTHRSSKRRGELNAPKRPFKWLSSMGNKRSEMEFPGFPGLGLCRGRRGSQFYFLQRESYMWRTSTPLASSSIPHKLLPSEVHLPGTAFFIQRVRYRVLSAPKVLLN